MTQEMVSAMAQTLLVNSDDPMSNVDLSEVLRYALKEAGVLLDKVEEQKKKRGRPRMTEEGKSLATAARKQAILDGGEPKTTKDLKVWLSARGVPLPAKESHKSVYMDLYKNYVEDSTCDNLRPYKKHRSDSCAKHNRKANTLEPMGMALPLLR